MATICEHCGQIIIANKFEKMEKIVCDYFGVTVEEIRVKCNKPTYVQPRQCIMYFATKYMAIPYRFLSDRYNKRDHTAIITARRAIKNALAAQDHIYADIVFLDNLIRTQVLHISPSLKVA